MDSRENIYNHEQHESYHHVVVDGMLSDDQSIWTTSNQMSTSPIYITVDTSKAFPEMPPNVVIDNESLMIDSSHESNVIYVGSGHPLNYSVSDNPQFEFEGKISVVESSNGLFCGECSAKLESPVTFFQHWVTHHCQLEQPAPAPPALENMEGEGAATTLTMERCNRCNHIFVEGTQRYKNHLVTCEQATNVEKATKSDVISTSSDLTGGPRTKRLKYGHVGSVAGSVGHSSSSNNKYVCGVCNAGVKTVTSFFLHWLELHQGLRDILQEVWQCRGCSGSKLFPDSISLQQHVITDHPNTRTNNEQSLCCPIPDCSARLASEEDVGHHLGQFHRHLLPNEELICSACTHVFTHNKEAYEHFRNEHQVTCSLCSCDIDKDSSHNHYLSNHRCEVIWNRNHSLQKVSRSPQVSQICTGANQGPVRLANGAIAKTSLSTKKESSVTSSCTVKPSSKYTLLRPDSTDSQEDKGYKCTKCTQVFTNLKVMERHYLSNHEFQCKFCSAVMDKDVYGQHLRQHLASERRKTTPITAPSPLSPSNTATVTMDELLDCS